MENLPEDLPENIKTGIDLWNKVSGTTGILKPIDAWAAAKALEIKTKSEIKAAEMKSGIRH